MTDDQHGEGTPRGGSRWDPLPQGEYDDGATAFVELPEGGVDALLAADSPLAAPGHGYVPPQITVSPATTAGTDPAATGAWPVPGAPVDGAQWHDPNAAHQQHGHEHGAHQHGHDVPGQPYGSDAPYDPGTPYGSGAGRTTGDDRFTYNPAATGQWHFEEAAAVEAAPGHDVTGQWSIPVAGGDLPDESGEFTTSSLVEQWGGTPPATLPGGAPAPWATQTAGAPWGQQDTAGHEQPGHPHEFGHEPGHGHGQQGDAGPAAEYAPGQQAGPLPRETGPDDAGHPQDAHAPGPHEDTGHGPGEFGHAPEPSGTAGHGPETHGAGVAPRPSEYAPGPHEDTGHGPETHGAGVAPRPSEYAPEALGAAGHPVGPSAHADQDRPEAAAYAEFAEHGPQSAAFDDHGSQSAGFDDHGSQSAGFDDHAADPADFPGHAPEAPGSDGHPSPADHAPEPSYESYEETPGPHPQEPGPETHPEAAALAQDAEDAQGAQEAREASQAAPGAGEAVEPAQDAPEAPEAADSPSEPTAGQAPAEADADAGTRPEAADGETPADPGPGEDPAAGPAGTTDAPSDAPSGTAPQEEHPLASYVLRVNGADRPVGDAWIGESLLYVLRERLGLAGAKDGCSQGECGACNVQVDGRLVASCLVPAVTAAGSEVRTVEGLAEDGQPSDVQRALARCGAVQCGFCVPGMAMTVHDLLEGNPAPTELETRQALCGNLCRCSGYRGVVDAVKEVVAEREAHAAPADGSGDEARIPHQAGPGAGGVNASAFGAPPQPHRPEPHSPEPHDQPYGQDGGPA
ncbi:2Fe-2S iron-sulfur cluster-binding protein [Streptomyces sp. NPDC050674]|uniref:2Fe-2S iron-sulfur cluster-binding protein n=1 Tax=Streptomyces sp. NPDC050674 TaxID=3157216 RepID=UPI003441FFB6